MKAFAVVTLIAAAVIVPTIGKLAENVKPINDVRFETVETSYQEMVK